MLITKKVLETQNILLFSYQIKNNSFLALKLGWFVYLFPYRFYLLDGKYNAFLFSNFSKLKSVYSQILNILKILKSGYFIDLIIRGVGYNVFKFRNVLYFDLGFSHFIALPIPKGLVVNVFKQRLVIFGYNKQDVIFYSKVILNFRKKDIYKGKGVYPMDYLFRLKEGKKR